MAVTVVMILGAVFIGIFSLPNLIAVLKTKNTSGINLPMYIIFVISCICFSVYGLGMTLDNNLSGGLPTLISNCFCVAIGVITLCIKFYNTYKAKKAHMTEIEYSQSLKRGK
jgi:uncharacterized protein with PQ loop repeat